MQVVLTEKERRDSEVEHQHVLQECTKVMEEYRATEKQLRTHITKSRWVWSSDGWSYVLSIRINIFGKKLSICNT